MGKSIIIIYFALIGISLVIISEFFIPGVRELFRDSFLFLLPIIIFSLLGIALILTTIKTKVDGMLKKPLLLTGISSAGFFVFIFLHNTFYGLGTITKHIPVLTYLLEGLHVIFFIIAIFGCPAGFLIGMGISMALIVRNKSSNRSR